MTGKPDGGTPPQAGTRCDDMGLKGRAHWVSLRMSGAPRPRAADAETDALPAGAPTNDDLIAEIEALRHELISAARAETAGAGIAGALSDAERPDEPRVPNLPVLIVQSCADVPERATFGPLVSWSAMAVAAAAVVAVLMLRDMPSEDAVVLQQDPARAPLLRAGERLPHFASLAQGIPTEQTGDLAAPGIVVAMGAVSGGARLLADADPLESVTMRGLPSGVRPSAGHRISATDWTIAAADLDEVRLVVPYDQVGPVRVDLAFASRSGLVLARMGLAIEQEPPPVALVAVDGARGEAAPVGEADALAPVGVAPVLAMATSVLAAVAPAHVAAHDIAVTTLSEPTGEKEAEAAPVAAADTLAPAAAAPTLAVSIWAPAAMAPAPFAAHEIPVTTLSEPLPRERNAKVPSRRPEKARAAMPRSAVPVPQPAVRPPRGLFPLEPVKVAKPAKAAAEAAAKAKTEPAALSGTIPVIAKPRAAPKPKQKQTPAALPTGHQIQSTLGGGFTVGMP